MEINVLSPFQEIGFLISFFVVASHCSLELIQSVASTLQERLSALRRSFSFRSPGFTVSIAAQSMRLKSKPAFMVKSRSGGF